MGSGFSGLSISVNIVGDATADFVVSSALEGSAVPRVFVLDGSLLAGLGPYSDIAGGNAISLSLPTDWVQNTPYQRDGVLRDINQDGAADFAVGEYSVGAIVGRVAVFW